MIHETIQRRLREVVSGLLPDADLESIRVQPSGDARFGDLQTPGLMAVAKARGMNPRQFAQEVVKRLDVSGLCESLEVAGAGFVNFRLLPGAVALELRRVLGGAPLFFEPALKPRTVVIDFSSPNVAKAMHVGHIRSTILGDCLARALRLLGHRVVTDNHIGDWGTQFGKLLVGWKRHLDAAALEQAPLKEMERLYKLVNQQCETEPEVLESARKELVRLQAGDEENLGLWQRMIAESRHEFDAVYLRLGVRFDHTLGESFYNPQLKGVVDELLARGIASESEGAVVVFFEEPGLKETPAIVRKSDGAANYATTDLATLRHRWETWRPDEIVYVTDGRQQGHFQQVFSIFRRWHTEVTTRLSHVWFGSILGSDGRPFSTRAGQTVRLVDLLDEAEERAFGVVTQKSPELEESVRKEIARVVGLGAVKYADLLPNRQSNYTFDWDRILALNGNTAPYIQYAHTRVRSIFRKGGIASEALGPVLPRLDAPEELALAKQLLHFGVVLEAVVEEHRPNYLCNYLYELAGRFALFFERCPVLKAEGEVRVSRLALCDLTARVLKQGLEVLGIEVSDQM